MLWSFWVACGLAVTGAILPLLLAIGGTNRISAAAIPFGVAAMALAAAALLYDRGRPLATALYFIAGLALVYGMLTMIALPLRLAVIGTCDPAPAICSAGFEQPMSPGENSGLAIGVAMGTLAILVGFFGLLMLFRIRPHTAAPGALPRWLRTAARLLRRSGTVTLIWRADGLAEVLNAVAADFGAIAVLPIFPKPSAPAVRVLVRAVKGNRAPLSLLPGFLLADAGGRPSKHAEAVLRGGAALPLARD